MQSSFKNGNIKNNDAGSSRDGSFIFSHDNNGQLKQLMFNSIHLRERKLKLLVANDNAFQLLIASTSLQQIPIVGKIDQAYNGQEALELVKKTKHSSNTSPYDVIFLDLDMPIMDGYTAATKINQFYDLVNDSIDYVK